MIYYKSSKEMAELLQNKKRIGEKQMRNQLAKGPSTSQVFAMYNPGQAAEHERMLEQEYIRREYEKLRQEKDNQLQRKRWMLEYGLGGTVVICGTIGTLLFFISLI